MSITIDTQRNYTQLCETTSDINQHLPTLLHYAQQCSHVTEFGTRELVSTYALLQAKPKYYEGYDIVYHPQVQHAKSIAQQNGTLFNFHEGSTVNPGLIIQQTDFLFIDTLHCYRQLATELMLHADRVNKYIAFHDVVTFGYTDEEIYTQADKSITHQNDKTGLLPAIFEFLIANPQWQVDFFAQYNNGLMVLKKI